MLRIGLILKVQETRNIILLGAFEKGKTVFQGILKRIENLALEL
jgi:hypothetical protein